MDRGAWQAAVHEVAKSRTRLSDFTFTFHFHALEKEMATHSSVLAWRIPGTGEPGGLPSMELHRVGHDWSDLAAAAVTFNKRLLKEANILLQSSDRECKAFSPTQLSTGNIYVFIMSYSYLYIKYKNKERWPAKHYNCLPLSFSSPFFPTPPFISILT